MMAAAPRLLLLCLTTAVVTGDTGDIVNTGTSDHSVCKDNGFPGYTCEDYKTVGACSLEHTYLHCAKTCGLCKDTLELKHAPSDTGSPGQDMDFTFKVEGPSPLSPDNLKVRCNVKLTGLSQIKISHKTRDIVRVQTGGQPQLVDRRDKNIMKSGEILPDNGFLELDFPAPQAGREGEYSCKAEADKKVTKAIDVHGVKIDKNVIVDAFKKHVENIEENNRKIDLHVENLADKRDAVNNMLLHYSIREMEASDRHEEVLNELKILKEREKIQDEMLKGLHKAVKVTYELDALFLKHNSSALLKMNDIIQGMMRQKTEHYQNLARLEENTRALKEESTKLEARIRDLQHTETGFVAVDKNKWLKGESTEKNQEIRVNFKSPYFQKPMVILGATRFMDLNNAPNVEEIYQIKIVRIDTSGFTYQVKTAQSQQISYFGSEWLSTGL